MPFVVPGELVQAISEPSVINCALIAGLLQANQVAPGTFTVSGAEPFNTPSGQSCLDR